MSPPATTRRTLDGHTGAVVGCAVAPDGTWIVSASADKTLRIWDVASGETRRTLTGHTDAVWGCAVAPDGTWIVSASEDKTLRIWDAASGETRRTLTGHTDSVRGCAVAPDGSWIVSASADKTLRIWDAASGRPVGASLAWGSGTIKPWGAGAVAVPSSSAPRLVEHPMRWHVRSPVDYRRCRGRR